MLEENIDNLSPESIALLVCCGANKEAPKSKVQSLLLNAVKAIQQKMYFDTFIKLIWSVIVDINFS
jgi:hypothetical protein